MEQLSTVPFDRLLTDPALQVFPTTIASTENYGPDSLIIRVDGGYIDGSVYEQPSEGYIAEPAFLAVSDEGHGKGSYLLGVFAREVALRGADKLLTDVRNPQVMRICIRIFKASNIKLRGGVESFSSNDEGYADYLVQLSKEGNALIEIDLTAPEVQAGLFAPDIPNIEH